MTEPSACRQFLIPVGYKRVMQLDDQVQITFERCVCAQTILIERASIKTNEDRPRATSDKDPDKSQRGVILKCSKLQFCVVATVLCRRSHKRS